MSHLTVHLILAAALDGLAYFSLWRAWVPLGFLFAFAAFMAVVT